MASMEEVLKEHTVQDRESFDELSKELKALREDIQAMRNEFARYKGFVGGVAFLGGAIATALAIAVAWFR